MGFRGFSSYRGVHFSIGSCFNDCRRLNLSHTHTHTHTQRHSVLCQRRKSSESSQGSSLEKSENHKSYYTVCVCVCVCVCYLVTARVHTVTMKQQPTITQPHPPSRGASEPLCCLPATIAAGSCSQFLVLVLVLGGLVKENKLVIESVVLNNRFTLVCLRKNQEVDLKIVVLKV